MFTLCSTYRICTDTTIAITFRYYLFILTILSSLSLVCRAAPRFRASSILRNSLRKSHTINVTTVGSDTSVSMKKIHIAGFSTCGAYKGAVEALRGLQRIFPDKFAVTIKECRHFPFHHLHSCLQNTNFYVWLDETRAEYMDWLPEFRTGINAPEHKTSPIAWFETAEGNVYLGGRDDTLAWCRRLFAVKDNENEHPTSPVTIDTVDPTQIYDYDLVVIGGGSGGLACSKEAQKLGARVAVLDYVKPSPHGSTWGLGGTCVNVGCIPKKLMHISATLGEHIKDSVGYGWSSNADSVHCEWSRLRDSIHDHIKSLNFGYRVQLREAGVTYINSLGRFIGPHALECVDGKGKVKVITGARFVLATGGRPTPLDIPGGELAITSDDIFTLSGAPGKTCIVGGGYVACECAGFLAGLAAGDVTLLARSTPLRTFDQDIVKCVVDYMTQKSGVKVLSQAMPLSITRNATTGRLTVRYQHSDSVEVVEEEFDTVLAAIGRTPDLTGLNLSALGSAVAVHAQSNKLFCQAEQTSVPHVYAVGDIVHDAPELTPVAIQAGKLLARRLYGEQAESVGSGLDKNKDKAGGSVYMDYTTIATAVFTPLELGTVGLTEEQAAARFGAEAVESYLSSFQPLEWTLSEQHDGLSCLAKVIMCKEDGMVLGMHMAAPNAGEVIQGYALALKKGLGYRELLDSVGIHPTIGEEFCSVTVAKSSGSSAAKAGC